MENQQLRELARQNGEKFFMPSSPCVRGHLVERRVDNSCCVECLRITARIRSRKQPRKGTRKDPNWAEAKTKGERFYTPRKPCKRGHLAMRTTIGRSCVECDKQIHKPKQLAKLKERNRKEGRREHGIRQVALERGDTHYFTGRPCVNGHVDWRTAKSKGCVSCSREQMRKDRATNPLRKIKDVVRAIMRNKRMRQATPKWVKTKDLLRIYKNRPEGYHVDHIVPIKHPLVCGLHVPANLQYLPSVENIRKYNKFEPQFITA